MPRYYKTSALKSTLERLIDFDRINHAKEMRLSVGAVNVRTGHFDYFDSEKITIRPEHVMASGAIPPGFPPVEIDGEQYWDGGLFSNTPLAYMVDYYPRRSRLIFQVDVFPAHGREPTNLAEVTERDKDIRYSSRTRVAQIATAGARHHRTGPTTLCLRLCDRDGYCAAHLSADGTVGRVQGLRVQPLDNGGAMEARAFRRARRFAGLAVARTDAGGARCARVRRDA